MNTDASQNRITRSEECITVAARTVTALFIVLTFAFTFLSVFVVAERGGVWNSGSARRLRNFREVLPDGRSVPVEVPGSSTVKDSHVVIVTKLPYTIQPDEAVSTRSSQQEVKVYINDELRTEYKAPDESLLGGVPASTYVFTKLKPEDASGILRIETDCNNIYTGTLGEVVIGTEGQIWAYYMSKEGVSLLLGVFLLLLSAVTLVTVLILRVMYKMKFSIIYLAYAMVATSLWIIMDHMCRQMFVPDVEAAAFCAFAITSILPIPFALYMNELQGRRYHLFYNGICLLSAISAVSWAVLDITGMQPYIDSLIPMNVAIVLMIAFVIFTMSYDLIKKRFESYQSIAVGFIVFVLFGVAEIFVEFRAQYGFSKVFLTIGLLILFVTSLYSTIVNGMRSEQEKREALAANNAKSMFLASMSHEIRTPINSILGMNEMIMRESTEKKIQEYAADIDSAGNILLSTVNDILDYSKMESGKFTLSPAPYQTASVLNDSIMLLKSRAEKKNLSMKLDIDESIPAELIGDETRIRQIIINLMTNAVKYTETGEINFRVNGKRTADGKFMLSLAVKDTGIGIRKEIIDSLFTRFSRADDVQKKHIEGTGLGLAIVKQLVDLMGGEINVESVYGEGSLFEVSVPQEIKNEAPMGNVAKQQKTVKERKPRNASFTAPEARVLVTDDNDMNLKVFAGLLKRTLIKVDTASSGEEALRLTRENVYDIIFMDHMMPKPDGIETLHMIRKEENNLNRKTPVIALTANAMAGADSLYKREGFEGYLSKPAKPARLEEVLMEFLPGEKVNPAD